MRTLISFIGVGRRNENRSEGYKRTDYQFDDGFTERTPIFTEALIHHNKPAISECILIGTRSSSWGSLVERSALEDDNYTELYNQVEKEFVEKNISDESLRNLETALGELWRIPVHCHAHTVEISSDNVVDIMMGYVSELSKLNNTKLLIDITHAFRSMPVILMSSIQLLDSTLQKQIKIELIYGEFKNKSEFSPVRYLSSVWDGMKFARALRLFSDKLDSELLAEYLKDEWPEGANAINRLTRIIQSNFVTKLDEGLSQMRNSFNKLSIIENKSKYLSLSTQPVETFYKKISSGKELHNRIFFLAEEFAERSMYAQAIVYLHLSVESYVIRYYGKGEFLGMYEETKELTKKFSRDLKKIPIKRGVDKFHRLRKMRNVISHGGSQREGTENLPSVSSLHVAYTRSHSFLTQLYEGISYNN